MKSIDKFERFKLNKEQMSKVSGGIRCAIEIDGYVISMLTHPDLSHDEAVASFERAYGGYGSWACG